MTAPTIFPHLAPPRGAAGGRCGIGAITGVALPRPARRRAASPKGAAA
jgi:threonine/homoserine efflux transporter RhtA